MDTDERVNPPHPPSRDPRLAGRVSNKNFDSTAQSHDAVRDVGNLSTSGPSDSLVSAGPETSTSGQIIAQSLGILTERIITVTETTAEREKLRKKIESTEGSLRRAKTQCSFPSTLATFQQLRKDENNDLARIEEKLQEHKLLRDELELSVATLLNSNSSHKEDSETETKIRESRTEAESARTAAEEARMIASDTKKEVERLKAEKELHKPMMDKLLSLQARIDMMEKSTSNYSSSLANHTKEIKDSQDYLARVTETLARKADTEAVKERSLELMQQKLEDLGHNVASMNSTLQSLSSHQDDHKHLAEQITELRNASEAHKATVESIHKLEEQISLLQKSTASIGVVDDLVNSAKEFQNQFQDVTKHLTVLETALVASRPNVPASAKDAGDSKLQGNSGLTAAPETLKDFESRLEQLEQTSLSGRSGSVSARNREAESTSLEALSSEVKQVARQLVGLQNLQAMKDDLQFTTLEEMERKLDEHGGALEKLKADQELRHEIGGLALSVENMKREIGKRQATLDVGLLSLEERYNGLSTEPLVRHMIVAMQELYPLSPPALMDQINALRARIDQLKVPSDISSMSSQIEQTGKVMRGLLEQTEKDRNFFAGEMHRLSQNLNGLNQQHATLWTRFHGDMPPMIHDLRTLQDQFRSLMDRFNEHTEKVGQDIKDKEEERQALLHDMNQERDRLNNEVKSLANEVSDLKSASADNFQAMRDKIQDSKVTTVASLLERIHQSERSTMEQIETATKTFDESSKSTQKEVADALSRLAGLERVKETLLRVPIDKLTEMSTVQSPITGPSQSRRASSRTTSLPLSAKPNNSQGGEETVVDTADLLSPSKNERGKRRRTAIPSDEERTFKMPNLSDAHSSSRSTPSGDIPLLRRPTNSISAKKKKKRKKSTRMVADEVVNLDDD